MFWAIESILDKYLNGRELVVWGTGPTATNNINDIERVHPVSFYLSNDASDEKVFRKLPVRGVNPSSHYVVILVSPFHNSVRNELQNMGFKEYHDYFDYLSQPEIVTENVKYSGVKIGKGSFFPIRLY